MVYQYDWKIAGKYPIKAETAGKQFEKIIKRKGALTKENVLEAAKPKNSALHKCFEWDNDLAAEKYRLHQSGQMIRDIVKVRVAQTDNEPDKCVRAFINVSEPRRSARCLASETVFSDEKYREIALRNALYELKKIKDTYENLVELSAVFVAVEAVERAVDRR